MAIAGVIYPFDRSLGGSASARGRQSQARRHCVTVKAIQHVVFRGRVQGVGFRAFVEQQAMQFGAEGWVRNRRDGISVEAVFAGAAETVAAVIEACREGPSHGRVDAIDQRDGTIEELALRKQESFGVLPTV